MDKQTKATGIEFEPATLSKRFFAFFIDNIVKNLFLLMAFMVVVFVYNEFPENKIYHVDGNIMNNEIENLQQSNI